MKLFGGLLLVPSRSLRRWMDRLQVFQPTMCRQLNIIAAADVYIIAAFRGIGEAFSSYARLLLGKRFLLRKCLRGV